MRTLLLCLSVCTLTASATAQYLADNSSRPTTESLFQAGEQAYRNGDHAKAITLFTEVLAQDKENLNAYLQRGFCHSLQQQYDKAVADFTAVVQRKPDHLWAYTSRGSAYNKLGKPELAKADFDKVLTIDPKDQEAYNNRGWAHKAMGDMPAACKDWNTSRKMGNAEAKIILTNNRCK